MKKMILLCGLIVGVGVSTVSSLNIAQEIGTEPHGIVKVAQEMGTDPHVLRIKSKIIILYQNIL